MQISQVLATHNSYKSEHGQGDVLGDAFLLQENPVYRNVKQAALNIGCKYVEAWPQYLLLPFHELGKIVSTKHIPYVPNGRLLAELEAKRPGVFNVNDLPVPESHHLHEAAHVIAEHFFANISLSGFEEKILKTIICESFANTVDALACVPATTDIHRFFLAHHCYMQPVRKDTEAMARLCETVGLRCTFMLILIAYVHANFLGKNFSRHQANELVTHYAPGVELTPKLVKDCETLGKMSEKLDPQFRVQTTETYLKMEGYEGDVFTLLNFPFMQVFAKNENFRLVAERLAGVVEAS